MVYSESMKTTMQKQFEVVRCSLGYLVRPVEKLDNRRWYFERRADAESHAEYLERSLS